MSAKGVLSKGITFSYKEESSSTYTIVPDLQSIPSLGGDPEKVEVTTLADGARRYINGIKDYGDLEFKFLYANDSATDAFRMLKTIETAGKRVDCQVELPDAPTSGTGTHHGTQFNFKADLVVSMDEAEVNSALSFTLKCGLQSDITVVNPA